MTLPASARPTSARSTAPRRASLRLLKRPDDDCDETPEEPDTLHVLDKTRDYTPPRSAPSAADTAARKWSPGPELRPGKHEPTIACEHGHPSQPTTLAWCVYVVDSPETRSPAWWRARLPDGVDFRLVTFADGVDSEKGLQSARELTLVRRTDAAVEGLVIEPAPKAFIQTPEGPTLATLSTIKRADGIPTYFVAPVHWTKIVQAAVDKALAKAEKAARLGRDVGAGVARVLGRDR